MLGNFSCFCCRLLNFDFFKLFEKILSGKLSEFQMVFIFTIMKFTNPDWISLISDKTNIAQIKQTSYP